MSSNGDLRRRVILGLGNPGTRYAATRHNVGFRVVEDLARQRGIRLAPGECNCLAGHDEALFLAAPQTYMNRSGYAARCLSERHGFAAQDFLVVYDEVHLPLGKLRLRPGGRAAGHRGLESVLENLETAEVPRLRLGVCPADAPPPGDELSDFVLAPFAEEEREAAEEMIRRAAEACQVWARDGVEAAMQQYNG